VPIAMMLKEAGNAGRSRALVSWDIQSAVAPQSFTPERGPPVMPLPRRFIPSFTSLMAFEATARNLSFSQAAKELALSQGAISKHVRQLEELLGVVLLQRTRRQVLITEEGTLYLKEVRELISRLEQSTHSMLASGGSSAVLNLAVLPSFATKWLIPRLPRFHGERRRITVNLATRPVPFAFDYERFDSAIHYGSPHWPGTVATHLFDETVVAVASPFYCQELKLKAPQDLERATLLQQATRPSLWIDWLDSLAISLRQPYTGPMIDQFTMSVEAAAAGLGVALVPEFLVTDELASGRLTALFDHRYKAQHGYYLVTPVGKMNNPTVKSFTEWLQVECRS
jgi:LysR family glycine cleavage system transcriptional activator